MKSNYELKTEKVYSKIYSDKYNYHPKQVFYAKKNIIKNLKQSKINLRDLKKKNILNIGTGIESVVFNKLGAKKIYHFDLSRRAVKNLSKLSKKKKFKNIISNKKNVVKSKIILSEKIDFVFLQGVIHHFNNVEKGLSNIIHNIKVGGKIFLRVYKSGSISYFYVDFMRKFLGFKSIFAFDKIFKKRFKVITNSGGQVRTDFFNYLYNHCIDNLFVPSFFLIEKKSLLNFFRKNGFKNIYYDKNLDYFHDDLYNKKHISCSYIFKKIKVIKYQEVKIKHVDQLHSIKYREKKIKLVVSFLKKNLKKIKKLNEKKRINLAIDLFIIVEAIRFKHSLSNKIIKIRGKKIIYPQTLNEIYDQTLTTINSYIK